MDKNDQQKAGAYFTVNGFADFEEGSFKGRTKAAVTSLNACFLDVDLTPDTRRMEAEALLKELQDKGLPPTAVILTGKGLHVYWLFDEPQDPSERKVSEYEALQSAIVEHYKGRGADPQARDIARILRIPGSAYWDSSGEHTADIELLYVDSKTKYRPAQIAEYFRSTLHIDTPGGESLSRLVGGEFDLASVLNVKKGSRHHDMYSAALSLIQSAKDLSSARKMYKAVLSTWESPAKDPLDWGDAWRQFDSAKQKIEKETPQAFLGDSEGISIGIRPFEDIEEKPLEWLWEGFIARGKSHMLTGEPNLGKSQVTLDIAARLSSGRSLPSYTGFLPQQDLKPIGVIILSAEDDAADTIRPRLRAAGADLRYVLHLESALVKTDPKTRKKSIRSLSLREDAEQILRAIKTLPFEVGLIVIDPISAFLSGSQDSNSNSDARGTLAQLRAVIMSKGTALLMINHNNKNLAAKSAHGRSMGSVGWNADARATFYVFKEKSDEKKRVFSVGKANLVADAGKGFFYEMHSKILNVGGKEQSVPFIKWDESSFPTLSADEYSSSPMEKTQPKSDECAEELEMYMVGKSEVSAKEGLKYMKERGFSQADIYRTARKMGIIGEYGKWKRV